MIPSTSLFSNIHSRAADRLSFDGDALMSEGKYAEARAVYAEAAAEQEKFIAEIPSGHNNLLWHLWSAALHLHQAAESDTATVERVFQEVLAARALYETSRKDIA